MRFFKILAGILSLGVLAFLIFIILDTKKYVIPETIQESQNSLETKKEEIIQGNSKLANVDSVKSAGNQIFISKDIILNLPEGWKEGTLGEEVGTGEFYKDKIKLSYAYEPDGSCGVPYNYTTSKGFKLNILRKDVHLIAAMAINDNSCVMVVQIEGDMISNEELIKIMDGFTENDKKNSSLPDVKIIMNEIFSITMPHGWVKTIEGKLSNGNTKISYLYDPKTSCGSVPLGPSQEMVTDGVFKARVETVKATGQIASSIYTSSNSCFVLIEMGKGTIPLVDFIAITKTFKEE